MQLTEQSLVRRVSPLFIVVVAVGSVLGLISGSAFGWAPSGRAWSIFLAGFLWTMIVALGTTLARCLKERVRRGQWRRGLVLGCVMTFPPTTLYMLAAVLVSAGLQAIGAVQPPPVGAPGGPITEILTIAPIFYATSLGMAVMTGPLYAWTSPFRA